MIGQTTAFGLSLIRWRIGSNLKKYVKNAMNNIESRLRDQFPPFFGLSAVQKRGETYDPANIIGFTFSTGSKKYQIFSITT